MIINGYKIKYSEEELKNKLINQKREIHLLNKNSSAYQNLSNEDKKVVDHLVNAAKIMNDVMLEQYHPLNLIMKQALEYQAPGNEYLSNVLKLFNTINGITAHNSLEKHPVEIFEGITPLKGCNFYPIDLTEKEFHQILLSMLNSGKINEVNNILNARTMVRRKNNELVAIDFTEYFQDEFSEIANELECAAHYSTDSLFKEYLQWQAQALIQNNPDMDLLADKHWAKMQNSTIEFTISRENYEDEMTPSVYSNKELLNKLTEYKITPVSKDLLGVRVGIVNKHGTDLLLRFKSEMGKLANLMPFCDQYEQSLSEEKNKQNMVDADIIYFSGDYLKNCGAITIAQNLPNNDKLSVIKGNGRRNVYHRQIRESIDNEKISKILNKLIHPEFHQYFDNNAEHIFTIGHENGHSLGPNAQYQTALGKYQHIIEEHKANIISATMMPEYVKNGTITEYDLKKIYASWVINSHLLTIFPQENSAHRVADLIEYNYLTKLKAIYFDENNLLHINFEIMPQACKKILEDIIKVQLSKSPQYAKEYIDKWTEWSEMSKYVADFKQNLGIKPYIDVITYFD